MPNESSFWKDAASAIPVVGGVLGGMVSRGQDRRALERMLEYNTPANQLARLREAGLPFAAFSDTAAGNQSQAQPSTESGLNEIGKFATTRMMQKQMELLEAQINATNADAAKKEVEANSLQTDLNIKQMPKDAEPIASAAVEARGRITLQEGQALIQKYDSELKRIDALVKDELQKDGTLSKHVREQVRALVAQTKLTGVESHNREVQARAANYIIERMTKNGLTATEAMLLYKLQH